MEGSTLGVCTADGEGRAYFPDDGVLDLVLHSKFAPVRYCDDDGNETLFYPFNLNGSPLRVAAVCSPDGRHLAMMPHPERCFLMWQFPRYPQQWDADKKGPSPWSRMFQSSRVPESGVLEQKCSFPYKNGSFCNSHLPESIQITAARHFLTIRHIMCPPRMHGGALHLCY